MTAYQIFADATADGCLEPVEGLPAVEVLAMELEIGPILGAHTPYVSLAFGLVAQPNFK